KTRGGGGKKKVYIHGRAPRFYRARRYLRPYHDGQVALHGGEAREGLVAGLAPGNVQERAQRELGEEDRRRQVKGLADSEGHLAEPAHGAPSHAESGGAAL